jgi:hypothetical protein
MAHGHHRRDRSVLEAGPLDVLAAIPDPAEDPADELQYMIDEYGNAVCVDERPRRIFVSAAPIADVLEPKPPGYIWADGLEHDAPEPVMKQYLVDGRIDERANVVDARMLQPSYTYSRGSGSASNGGGVGKSPVFGGGGVNIYDGVESACQLNRHLLGFQIPGLTVGVHDFFFKRPDDLLEVMRKFVDEVIWCAAAGAPVFEPDEWKYRGKKYLICHGLSELQIQILRFKKNAGLATRALTRHAYKEQPDRMRLIDDQVAA